MELLDRYLQAVVKYLPRSRREDIVEELRANILEQVEDKEAELGRTLSIDEEELFLKQFGHPMLVAAKYLPQQYVIGPSVFPYYWFALKTVVPLVLLAYLALSALTFVTEPVTWSRIGSLLLRAPGIAVNLALWLTAIFAILEFVHAKYSKDVEWLRNWSPRTLPPVEIQGEQKRSHTIFELIASGFFVVWLIVVAQAPFLTFGPIAAYFKLIEPSPVWRTVYWSFVLLMAAQWIIEFIAMFHYSWRRIRPLLGLVGQAVVIVLLSFLVRAPQLFALRDAAHDIPKYQTLIENLNRGVMLGGKVLIIILAVQVVWRVIRMLLGRSGRHTLMLDRKCM